MTEAAATTDVLFLVESNSVVADAAHGDPELSVCGDWLERHCRVQRVRTIDEAERALAVRVFPWLIWPLPTRPLPSDRCIQRLLRVSPLTQIVGVTGTWLLAAGRTGRVPDGIVVCCWDRFAEWASRNLLAERTPQPRTTDPVESFLNQLPAAAVAGTAGGTARAEGMAIVMTDRRAEFETLGGMLRSCGISSWWRRTDALPQWPDDAPATIQGSPLIVMDVEPENLPKAFRWRERFAPQAPLLVCAGWQPEVGSEVAWIRKPCRLDDFRQKVAALYPAM